MADRYTTALKYTLVAINFFFVITGIISLYVGIDSQITNNTYWLFFRPGFFYLPLLCMLTAFSIFFFAVIGLYGTLKENYLWIITFTIGLFVVQILYLATAITSFVVRGDILSFMPRQLAWSMHNYVIPTAPAVQQWDLLQQNFECCGMANPNDWLSYLESQATLEVPLSCCSQVNGTVPTCSVNTAYARGCEVLFMNLITSMFDVIGFGGLFQSLMQGLIVVSVISALWLVKIGRERK